MAAANLQPSTCNLQLPPVPFTFGGSVGIVGWMFMRHIVRAAGGLLLVLAGCSTAPHGPTASQSRFAVEPKPPPPEPYVRVLNSNSNKVELQIAVRKFVP